MSRQLETVRQVRQSERDTRQHAVTEALAALDLLDNRLSELNREAAAWQQMRRQRGMGGIDVDYLASANRYRWLLAAQEQHFRQERQRLVDEIERRQAALLEAERSLKAIEKLLDKRQRAADAEQRRQAQHQLDEAAGTAWWRREVNR